MAQLKDLIVAGASRFLGKTYFEDSVTFNDTLILAKSQDLSGTADNRPALIVGGLPSESHIEIDANEIQAKSSGTAVASLYINNDGGQVILSGYVTTAADGNDATATGGGALRITGGLSTTKASYFGGAITAASTLGVSGKTTLSGEALLKGATKIENTLNVTKATDFDSTVNIDGKLTLGGNIAYQNGSYATYDVIKFLTGDDNGAGIVIGGGGAAIFGSGESASNLATAASISGTSETTYITSDNNIEFYTNCQTIGNRVGVILNSSRQFYPNANGSGSLGISGNVWDSLYVNTANINGNATIKGALVVNGTTTLKGTLTLGTYVDQATVPSDGGIIVMDLRNATITPDSFGDRRVNFYFDQITDDFYTTTSATSPSSATKWMGILHIKGWKDNTYAAWELAGNADTTSVQDTLRFRQGIGTTWGAWQSVITDANMNQYMDGRYVNVTGDSMTGHLYMTGSHATSSTSNTSQIVMGTATTQHFALTANDKAVVFNPSTTNTEHQIVLYLKSGTQSIFPNGISVGGILSTSSGNDASGSTGSGDLRVSGGAGIAKKLYVGSTLTVNGNIYINQTAGSGTGLSLYGTSAPTIYGIHMSKTATYGTYGQVSSDWATYFCSDGDNKRGWIFRHAGTNVFSINGQGTLSIRENIPGIFFRPGHASYDANISYQTAGNEAMVFTTKNAVTSFMFVNGEDTVSNISASRWTSLTPGLQIKQNRVSIGGLIGDGSTPTYQLAIYGNTWSKNTLRIGTTSSMTLDNNWCEGIRINAPDGQWVTIALGTNGETGTNTYCWSLHRTNTGNFSLSRGSSDGANGLLINTSGYVGIGTTGPAYRLHVIGDIYANGGWLRVSGTNGLFFESYGGGFYMSDTTWVRTYNEKSFYCSQTIGAGSRIYTGYDSGAANSVSCSNWFRSSGVTGLYNTSYGTHLMPNTVSNYAGWRMSGALGGYHGILFGDATTAMAIMSIDNSHQGLYTQSGTGWIIYNNNANTNIGIRTSSLTSGYNITLGGSTSVTGELYMGNNNITGVNNLSFADPGAQEGITWAGGNGWWIYEAPDNLSNGAGNLQFVHGSTRRLTINTDGYVDINARLVVRGNGSSYNEGIRILPASNGWSNVFFSANTTLSDTHDGGWLIGRRGAAGTTGGIGDFTIEEQSSSGANLTIHKDSNGATLQGMMRSTVGFQVARAAGDGYGIGLYGSSAHNSYGIHMSHTSTYGKHGFVQGDWATYFCFDGATNRGWIFKQAGTNVASISGTGGAKFDDTVFSYAYTRSNNKAAFMWDKPGSNYTGVGANGSSDTIWFGACDASGNWVDYKQKWMFYGKIEAAEYIYAATYLQAATNIYVNTGSLNMLYNNTWYEPVKNHNNGNITLNAAGGNLYIGYQTTGGIIMSSSNAYGPSLPTTNLTPGRIYYKLV